MTDFNSDATTSTVTEVVQSDLTTGGGDIIFVVTLGDLILNDGSDSDGIAVEADGSEILLTSLVGSVTGNADVLSGTGHITIYANVNIVFNADADISTGSDGTIELYASTGVITLATDADQTADAGDIRFYAIGAITLGGVITTDGSVSLISVTALIIDGDSDGSLDVDAAGLRVSAIGFGSNANAVETDLEQFAADVTTGGIFLDDQGAVVVGTVTTSIERIVSDLTSSTITDAALTGAIATTGAIEITAAGNLTVETVDTAANLTLTSTSGSIFDGGDTATDLISGGTLTLVAANGLGASGTGGLELQAPNLNVQVTVIGSAYLNISGITTLDTAALNGAGNLYINQRTGDLSVAGAIALTNGLATLTTRGALAVNADVTTTDYLRLVGDSIDVNDSALIASNGDVDIRSRNAVDFDATSSVSATNGSIEVIAGTTLSVGDFHADDQIELRARGNITRGGGELAATGLKIYSQNGQVGASDADPILTNVDRLDVLSAGEVFISEADSLEFGRTGLGTSAGGANDTLSVKVGPGSIGSVTGEIEFEGLGTLEIESSGDLTLATGISATNGDVVIISNTLTDGTVSEDVLIEALNGRVTITAGAGVGAAGVADIDIATSELVTTTSTGSIILDLLNTTKIVGDGVTIDSGAGDLILNTIAGNLIVDANVRHSGSGATDIDVVSGALSMTSLGRVLANSGSLNILVSSSISLSQIRSTSGTIRIESLNSSVRQINGFAPANIISTLRAEIYVDTIADLLVDSNSVLVNGFNVNRSIGEDFITIALNFG